ncbi:MAG: transcriptional regulator [Clostridiales bacterium 43-6]|nr:MAG: transcriptional regulator [Clostridiales bacterium 43-6]
MRISSKGRYGLASMVYMAEMFDKGECITILSISDKLGLSKIYLEQVFALLKRAGLVTSVKGAQGGYKISAEPAKITVLQVLRAAESSLFEKTEVSVNAENDSIEKAMQSKVFEAMEQSMEELLGKITLQDLVIEAEKHNDGKALMFYI